MEQQKTALLMDLNTSRHTLEELNMERANMEKNNKMMQVRERKCSQQEKTSFVGKICFKLYPRMLIPTQNDLHESTNRLEDLYQSLNEGDIVKKRWKRHFFKVLIFSNSLNKSCYEPFH